jgi:polar amino acid transport system substrate-binding protein
MKTVNIVKCIFLCLLANVCSTAFAGDYPKPKEMIFAHEDQNAYPWVLPVGENAYVGIDLGLLKLLEKELGVTIHTQGFSWTGCLLQMESGAVDGAFAASYKADREQYGKFPTKDSGGPDESKRIHTSGYSLYTRKDLKVTFDGEKFDGLQGMVAAQKNFSIVAPLQSFGVQIDDFSSDPLIILTKLKLYRVEAAALQTARADNVIANQQGLADIIVKCPADLAPFGEKPYFLMLSHQFVEKYPEFAKEIWDKVEKIRESEEYKTMSEEFYNKKTDTP